MPTESTEPRREAPAPELRAEAIRKGDADALARALDCVEDVRPAARARQRALISALERVTPEEHAVVGLTGPPGAGKSTLAGALIRHWLDRGLGVGMTAIDPSSTRSGGALLGDRTRLRFAPDARTFVRSMATRDQLGGLAPATRAAARVLRTAFEWSLIETVGVGQSEIAIENVADLVVLVLQPGAGDTLQFMKAGILEIPDVLVVHKWDMGREAERTRADLESILALRQAPSSDVPPCVLGVSAQTGHGVAELAERLETLRNGHAQSGELLARRRRADTTWAIELYLQRFGTYGMERMGGPQAVRRLADELPGNGLDRFSELAARAALEA